MVVQSQLVRPIILMARGRGPWRNSSAPIIIGIGPEIIGTSLELSAILSLYTVKSQLDQNTRLA